MSEWQAIATAPKDGTRILLARTDSGKSQSWLVMTVGAYAQHKFRTKHGWKREHSMGGAVSFTPTHWMPLPWPPEAP